MSINNRILRGAVAFLVAAASALFAWILLGAFVPVWIMETVYGVEAVHSAPAHGSAILILTVPFVGLLAVFLLIGLTVFLYEKLSPR
jgi:hypothetical protein